MYFPEWKGGTEKDDTKVIKRSSSGQLSPWVYLDPSESNSSSTFYGRIAFYPGGGYVAELGDTVGETEAFVAYLKTRRWIDKYTRAVFIEGALYNPNTNLIGVMETGIEVTSANILLPRVNIISFRLIADLNPSYAFYSACEFLFFGILLFTMYAIVKGIYQRKKAYFRETISWLDIIFFVDGVAIVVVYILRASRLKHAVNVLNKDQESFLNFSECASYSETLVVLYALADFIAILKFIHFLSFTRCVQLLSTTIYRSVVELQSFAVMLFTVYMGYASLAFTIYGPYLEDYRSFSTTLGSLSSLLMGVFDHNDFTSQTDYKVTGYFFFASFSCSMMFVFTNIVITIINCVHKDVSSDEDLRKNEENFFNIIIERLLILTGFQGPPKHEEQVIEEPPISELQWNLNVQYIMDSQLKRLNGLVNAIYIHDEVEDILLTSHVSGNHGNLANQVAECEQGGIRAKTNLNSDQLSNAESIPLQLNTTSASGQQNNSIETISQLIVKKTEELTRLEDEGNCDERERLLRVKVIKCLEELLDKVTRTHHDSGNLTMNCDDESEV